MLAKFSVKKPYTVVVAVIVVLVLGVISFMNMTTDLLPSFDLPYVMVMTTYPGASPEEVEQKVTKPLEKTLATTSNLKLVNSISRENASIVILEFYQTVNMDSAIIEMDGKLDLAKSQWDNEMIGSPMIMRLNPDALPIMLFAFDEDGLSTSQIKDKVQNIVLPEIERIPGVASAEATGLLEEQVKVSIDQSKIDALNDRILELVDSELADAKRELDQAKKEVSNGKAELASKGKQGSIQMGQAGAALTDGKIAIAQKETELNVAITQLSTTKQQLTTLLAGLKDQQQQLLAMKAVLEAKPQPLSPEDTAALIGINENLAQLNGLISETEASVQMIESQLKELASAASIIEQKKTEVQAGESQLIEGEAALTSGINTASSELTAAEVLIKAKEMEFEQQRDAALEKASIDGIVTPDTIAKILSAQNFSMPAGYLAQDGSDYLVKVGDELQNIEELEHLPLMDFGLDGIETVYLSDVADITKIDNSDEMYAKINGNDGIIITVQKQSMYSTADVSKNVQEAFSRLLEQEEGAHFTILMDQGYYIGIVVDNVINNLLYGAILAIIVLFFFLRSLKPTLVVAFSIPISVIFALVLMYFSGVTLNVISLAGLALGVGMLVDNSIVVIENIFRMRSEGVSAKKAAIEGARQVSGAIIASTLTTVCVFLPIVFVQGISRDLFSDMGLTIAYSLLASLIVALTLVPAMSASLLKNSVEKKTKLFDKFKEGYGRALAWTLKRKAIILVPVFALLALSLYNILAMGTAFMPQMDSTQISISLEMPEKTTFEDTKTMSNEIMDRVMTIDDVETIGAMSGGGSMMMITGGGMGGGGTQSASLYVILKEDKAHTSQEIADQIREKTKDLDCDIFVSSSNMDISTLSGSGIEVQIRGKDMDTLQKLASEVAELLQDTEGTVDISDGLERAVPELRIRVDKQKAIEKGFTVAQVYSSVSQALSEGSTATTLNTEDNDYPVVVVDSKNETITKTDLEELKLTSDMNGKKSEAVLKDIASIEDGQGLPAIRRESQERFITVSADVDSEHNIGLVSREFSQKLEHVETPQGYTISIKGENQTIMDALDDLIYMLALAVALVYLIMVAQFQSLLSPFIVMFTIPLAYTGGLLALQIGGFELSVIALLGFLLLTGIVVNNGIVLIDYINQLRRQGIPKNEAILLAAKTRVRPILMTALTTIFGLLTLSLGIGTGADMLQPMAVVTIFGLAYATVLTLFFIPILYDIFQRKELAAKPEDGEALQEADQDKLD